MKRIIIEYNVSTRGLKVAEKIIEFAISKIRKSGSEIVNVISRDVVEPTKKVKRAFTIPTLRDKAEVDKIDLIRM